MAEFTIKDSGERAEFEGGGHRDTEDDKLDYTLAFDGPMFERYARHMTNGAKKYEARNWMKFTDQAALDRAKRSLARHFMQYMRGERDEDHAAAIIFNLNVIERIEGLMKLDLSPLQQVVLRHNPKRGAICEACSYKSRPRSCRV